MPGARGQAVSGRARGRRYTTGERESLLADIDRVLETFGGDMAKRITQAAHSRQDATLRNVRAGAGRDRALEAKVAALARRVAALERAVRPAGRRRAARGGR